MFQFYDRIAQKIEMPFPDYEMTAMSMTQYKNYSDMMIVRLSTDLQEIILDYLFEYTRRQTHACKLNINYTMKDLYERFLNIYPTPDHSRNFCSQAEMDRINHVEWTRCMFGQKAECSFCRKKFLNFQDKAKEYYVSAPNQRYYTNNWEWGGEICNKCDKRYNIERLFEREHEDVIVAFMHEVCEGETQAERDEIAYNWIGMRQDGDDDY
jgi:hypothetical protein